MLKYSNYLITASVTPKLHQFKPIFIVHKKKQQTKKQKQKTNRENFEKKKKFWRKAFLLSIVHSNTSENPLNDEK